MESGQYLNGYLSIKDSFRGFHFVKTNNLHK